VKPISSHISQGAGCAHTGQLGSRMLQVRCGGCGGLEHLQHIRSCQRGHAPSLSLAARLCIDTSVLCIGSTPSRTAVAPAVPPQEGRRPQAHRYRRPEGGQACRGAGVHGAPGGQEESRGDRRAAGARAHWKHNSESHVTDWNVQFGNAGRGAGVRGAPPEVNGMAGASPRSWSMYVFAQKAMLWHMTLVRIRTFANNIEC